MISISSLHKTFYKYTNIRQINKRHSPIFDTKNEVFTSILPTRIAQLGLLIYLCEISEVFPNKKSIFAR